MKVNKSFWICLGVMAALGSVFLCGTHRPDGGRLAFVFRGGSLVRRSRRDLCGAAAAAAVEPAGLVRPFVPSGRVAGFLYG